MFLQYLYYLISSWTMYSEQNKRNTTAQPHMTNKMGPHDKTQIHTVSKWINTAEPSLSVWLICWCDISRIGLYPCLDNWLCSKLFSFMCAPPGRTPRLTQVFVSCFVPQSESDHWFTINPYALTALGYPTHNSAAVAERMKTSALWQQINYSLSLRISLLNKIRHNYISIQWTQSFITYAEEIQ